MCPRELVEKDEHVRERKINRDGQATLVSSCAGTGNNRGWLEFNGRAAQYALSETTSSVFFFLLFSFFLSFLFGFSLSLTSRYRSNARLLSTRNRRILEPISFTRSTRHYQTGCCSCNIVPRFSHALLELLALLASMEIDLRWLGLGWFSNGFSKRKSFRIFGWKFVLTLYGNMEWRLHIDLSL